MVCGAPGAGEAVLLRALRPTHGLAAMAGRRGLDRETQLCAGPGRLCQALGIDGTWDGQPIGTDRVALTAVTPPGPVAAGPRIGISQARDLPWRFGLSGSPYLSRPLRA